MFRGRGLRPLSVCCLLPLRGRGLRPPGPVAAPLVPRSALLPAPSPWARAEPRQAATTHVRRCCGNPRALTALAFGESAHAGGRHGAESQALEKSLGVLVCAP